MDTQSFSQFNLLSGIKIALILFITCMLCISLASCGGDSTSSNGGGENGGETGGGSPPDPTFTNVQKIFSGSCATSGCHNSSTKQNGVDLSSYDAAISSVGSQYGKKVIQPDDAAGSPLVDKISSNNPKYGVRMPYQRPALSNEDINLIKQWINNGAKDN